LISTQAYQRENAREREHKGRAPTQRRNGNVKLGLLALSLCQRRLRCSLNHLEPIQTFASCHSISSAHPSTSTCVFAPCERESHVKREQRKNTAHYHYQFPYSHIRRKGFLHGSGDFPGKTGEEFRSSGLRNFRGESGENPWPGNL